MFECLKIRMSKLPKVTLLLLICVLLCAGISIWHFTSALNSQNTQNVAVDNGSLDTNTTVVASGSATSTSEPSKKSTDSTAGVAETTDTFAATSPTESTLITAHIGQTTSSSADSEQNTASSVLQQTTTTMMLAATSTTHKTTSATTKGAPTTTTAKSVTATTAKAATTTTTKPDTTTTSPPKTNATTTTKQAQLTCTISIDYKAAGGGYIMQPHKVTFAQGDTVFDVLKRECKASGIHMEFKTTPLYNSAYIEGINNLYEFDKGPLSGWMYNVNGWYPNYGCSQYKLKNGDVIQWRYTTNLGKDIGGSGATQG